MDTANEDNTFYVGLCMAGAVSAGAYTAGVMDFLIETLNNWEKHRKKNGVPTHRVVIPVIGGASAGGMTGILTAAAMGKRFQPVSKKPASRQPDNPFYHTWVDMTDDDMFKLMLSTSDIRGDTVHSLLNANFIDTIAGRVVQVAKSEPTPPFFAENLKLFVTLTNLEGFGFNLPFSGGGARNTYDMSLHNDYACFMLNKKQTDYAGDGWIPLCFNPQVNTEIAKDAAMATGAFPGGLKARKLTRDARYVNDNDWIKLKVKPDVPKYESADEYPSVNPVYESVNVDGGIINNEPFELVRELLYKRAYPTKDDGKANADYKKQSEDFKQFSDTVLMIDPFPSADTDFSSRLGLSTVLPNTLSALFAQVRIKPQLFRNAVDIENCPTQFLIAPSRKKGQGSRTTELTGSRALACGALGGFSGFLSKEFRIHDYFLGRANCQSFLQKYFVVPHNTPNRIFVNGYKGMESKYLIRHTIGGQEKNFLPIIPVLDGNGNLLPAQPPPVEWPQLPPNAFRPYKSAMKRRASKILCALFDWNPIVEKIALGIAANYVTNKVIKKLREEMTEHELM